MLEFPNKNKQKFYHHIGVEFLLFKSWISWRLFPPATAQKCFCKWELLVPREDIWISLGNNFGMQGGPVAFNLSLPLQFTLHGIHSCTLYSSQGERLIMSMP